MSDPTEPPAFQPEPTVPPPTGPAPSLPVASARPPIDPTGEVFVQPDDEDVAPEEVQKTSALRRAGVVSARVVLGVVCLAVVAATIGAATLLPFPRIGASASSTTITPVPTSQQIVCPGGLVRIATSTGKSATTASSLGDPAVVGGASPGSVDVSSFAQSDAATGGTLAAPRLLTTQGSAGTTLESGAQSQSVSTSEFTGLASASCVAASGDAWLDGGATSVGRTTLLLLANPTDVAATVSLQIFGESGPVTAAGMTGIPVPAGGQRVLSLAGVAPVVHVTSTGGQVVATLEQSTTRGLDPGGIDFVGTQQSPTTTTVIPGIVVAGTAGVQALLGKDGYDDLATTLRVYVPGTKSVTASVSILADTTSTGAAGGSGTTTDGATGKAIRVTLQPGVVTDLPLDGLSDGSYTIIVTTKAPVIASARVSTASSAANPVTDFAWLAAAPLLTRPALVTVAPNMAGEIQLENPGSTDETVTLAAVDGTKLTATVPAGGATSVAVTAGTNYTLSGYKQLYAAVSGTTDGGVTGYVVNPGASGQTPIRIYG